MPLMRERYTGTVFDVAGRSVERRLEQGYVLAGEWEPERGSDEAVEAPESDEAETGGTVEEPKPTEDATIAEIRAYAKRHGISLPKSGRKAELLAFL